MSEHTSLSNRLSDLHNHFPNSTTLGLERIHGFLELLGFPQKKLPPVIHLAGTNGKGSTLAFLKALFETSGKSVHCFISPHLMIPNERIILNGHPISDQNFHTLIDETLALGQKIRGLSWFEFLTGIAFLAFSRQPADILLLETGLGGRLDATNSIEKPLATLITSISYDHEHFLGNGLEKIAFEKAGIFKPETPVFSVSQPTKVQKVLQKQAQLKKCPFYEEGQHWQITNTPTGSHFQNKRAYDLPKPALCGSHQLQNAGLAIACFSHFFPRDTSSDTLESALKNVQWPGRLQCLEDHPYLGIFPQGSRVWVDGAHNEGGAKALARSIQSWTPFPILAISLLKSKDSETFLKPLVKPGKIVFLMPCPSQSPSHDPENLALIVRRLGGIPLIFDSHWALFSSLKNKSNASLNELIKIGPLNILFCGSLYTVGSILSESTKERKPFFKTSS